MSSRNPGSAYQGALEASIALAISLGAGVWADDHFDTSPGFLLAGLGIGFAAFTVRLMRLAGERDETGRDDPENGQK
ncbi:MAG: AtpZ/AtpI family protein [Myxococcota bacterium]